MKLIWLFASTVLLTLPLSLQAQPAASVDQQILDLFERRCAECHGRQVEEKKRKGNKQMFLDKQSTLSSLAASKALIIGNPADSAIIQRVTTTEEDDKMPAKGDPPLQLRSVSCGDGLPGQRPRCAQRLNPRSL